MKKGHHSVSFFHWRISRASTRDGLPREREKNRPLAVREEGRFFEWQPPRERNRVNNEGGENGWRQQCDGTRSVPRESLLLRQQKENFCLPKVLFLFIQAAGLAYHRRTTCGAYHQGRLADLVSHQAARVCTFGDDIRLTAMIYTLKRDDIPSLRLG